MMLKEKELIVCNWKKPTKAEIYTLAAELVETEGHVWFGAAVLAAMTSFDYYAVPKPDVIHDYFDELHPDLECYYQSNINQIFYNFSSEEKVIALLFLAAMYTEAEEIAE